MPIAEETNGQERQRQLDVLESKKSRREGILEGRLDSHVYHSQVEHTLPLVS